MNVWLIFRQLKRGDAIPWRDSYGGYMWNTEKWQLVQVIIQSIRPRSAHVPLLRCLATTGLFWQGCKFGPYFMSHLVIFGHEGEINNGALVCSGSFRQAAVTVCCASSVSLSLFRSLLFWPSYSIPIVWICLPWPGGGGDAPPHHHHHYHHPSSRFILNALYFQRRIIFAGGK